mmetsp:Transcript_3657/g.10046  ORF Transcript_3657/g.10046 Transcript_3657/m.10046 type:complete len:145 (-) Transcript_3657:348-782(-)
MAAANPALADIKGEVAHRLEESGALDQLRTQIRASVYRALLASEGDAPGDCSHSAPTQSVAVVADFLQRLGCDHTREVFLQESSEAPLGREELARGLGSCVDPADEGAVLEQLLAAAERRAAAHAPDKGQQPSGVPPTIPEVPG